jgi:hypothetical protein
MTVILICTFTTTGITGEIHEAVKKNQLTEVKRYVERGDIELPDKNGLTPLLVAAYYGHTSIVKYLCDAGAMVNADDNKGWTSLMFAAYYNYIEIANILLAHNANKNMKNPKGYTAYYYAQKYGHHDIAKMLAPPTQEVKIAKIPVKSSTTTSKYRLAILPWSLKLGVRVGNTDKEFWTSNITKALSETIDKSDLFITLFSYYELETQYNTQIINSEILGRDITDNLWKGKFLSSKLNINLASQVGTKLEVDAVLLYDVSIVRRDYDPLKVYLIDTKSKKVYKATGETYDFKAEGNSEIMKITEKVFSDYEKDKKYMR